MKATWGWAMAALTAVFAWTGPGASMPAEAAPQESLIAPGGEITQVHTGMVFTEGPAADAGGNVYFTDIRAGRIYRWSCAGGAVTLYREETNSANGMMFDRQGRLLFCEGGGGRVAMDDLKGNIVAVASEYNGKPFNSTNDLWIDPKGGVYFSDPPLGPNQELPQDGAHAYYAAPGGKPPVRVTTDLTRPNGLIGTPDGKTLYIADPGQNQTWAFAVQPDGTLAGKKLFCERGSDGMALDERGNVYLTNLSSIWVYSPDGQLLQEIPFPERPANLTFAGPDRKTLFVTARTSVYTLPMAVRGAITPVEEGRGK